MLHRLCLLKSFKIVHLSRDINSNSSIDFWIHLSLNNIKKIFHFI